MKNDTTPAATARHHAECYHVDHFQIRVRGKCVATLNRDEAMLLFADLAICLSDFLNPDTSEVLESALRMWDANRAEADKE